MTDTPQTAWMREYEERRALYGIASMAIGEAEDADAFALRNHAKAELDAHVRGLLEENERLRWALVKIAAPDADDINPFGIARAALTTPKDAP